VSYSEQDIKDIISESAYRNYGEPMMIAFRRSCGADVAFKDEVWSRYGGGIPDKDEMSAMLTDIKSKRGESRRGRSPAPKKVDPRLAEQEALIAHQASELALQAKLVEAHAKEMSDMRAMMKALQEKQASKPSKKKLKVQEAKE
jgi:hypothetical protein